jgi:hypothetical protein
MFGWSRAARSLASRLGGDALGEDLDRHLAVEGRIDRFPDHAHPAFADLLGQAVVE